MKAQTVNFIWTETKRTETIESDENKNTKTNKNR